MRSGACWVLHTNWAVEALQGSRGVTGPEIGFNGHGGQEERGMAAPYDLVIRDHTSIRTETDEAFGRLFAKTEDFGACWPSSPPATS